MAEINLLKSTEGNSKLLEVLPLWIVRVLIIAIVGVLVYYGFLFFKVKNTTKEIANLNESIVKAKSTALSMPERKEFLVRQAQLKEFAALTESHSYFSKLLPALARVTLKTAYYNTLTVSGQGKISLQVVAPSLRDLDKYLQVFDQPEISKDFYNVRLGGFSKGSAEGSQVYLFNIQMDYNPALTKH